MERAGPRNSADPNDKAAEDIASFLLDEETHDTGELISTTIDSSTVTHTLTSFDDTNEMDTNEGLRRSKLTNLTRSL